MVVTISSRKTVVPPRLEEVTREKLERLTKLIDGMDRAEVHFAQATNPRLGDRRCTCEVTMYGHGHTVRAQDDAPDLFAALDRVVDKLENQLHKLKTRLVRRYHGGVKAGSRNAKAQTTIVPTPEEIEENGLVRTKRFVLSPMSPADAAFEMELLGHSFYFFSNAETGRPAVVYRRDDGGYGLIEEDVGQV
ncbi:MAG TPA: ribosome-associated translation inhibitor RaiA [Acidimicrobiales bacterium]